MSFTPPTDAIEAPFGQLVLLIGMDEVFVLGPGAGPDAAEISGGVEAVREHVRHSTAGHFRPLSGMKDMPGGWFTRVPTLDLLSEVLDAVYPLAQRHVTQYEEGTLRVVSLDEVLGRQSGRYEESAHLSAAGRSLAQGLLCGSCVRTPVWGGERPPDENGIPCPEACSVMVSLCREGAEWERDRPERSAPDRSVAFAAFETPGNVVREAYLRAMVQPGG
ncbi:MAG: hypothetical protein KC495_04190 [Dehalococcoidia bacterium]|nr:hypothetical protein [Dehalococcoidia bacterium]MCB9485821.1 hypothetical protein [Thermoflexaceae bacterium]